MARYAHVKNWRQFQHYKDRNPPWIKLQRSILDDYEFQCLPIASKAIAPCIWLLASESDEGAVRIDLDWLSFRLRMDQKTVKEGLKPLIDHGFLKPLSEDDSSSLSDCVQDACLEAEAEAETEVEKNTVHFAEFWSVWPNKKGKADAEKAWRSKGCDKLANKIIAHVKKRKEQDPQWTKGGGKFIPLPATFLRGERWEDEWAADPKKPDPTEGAI